MLNPMAYSGGWREECLGINSLIHNGTLRQSISDEKQQLIPASLQHYKHSIGNTRHMFRELY